MTEQPTDRPGTVLDQLAAYFGWDPEGPLLPTEDDQADD